MTIRIKAIPWAADIRTIVPIIKVPSLIPLLRLSPTKPFSSDPFGAFGGSAPNNNNNNPPFNRPPNQMGMNSNNFGMNSMPSNQQYGGMKRPPNQMNDDNNMSKRARPDTGSWGSMSMDGSNNANYQHQHQHQQHGSQQPHNGGNWYQDQGYNSSQQANYSWNWPVLDWRCVRGELLKDSGRKEKKSIN